jgi:predicted RND superfamily exporter protein
LVEARSDGKLTDPKVLTAVDDLETFMAREPNVGGVTSIVDHIKRVHQAMHDGDRDFYRVPDDQRLIDRYLFLYGMSSGPDGLSSLIDDGRRALVIRALSKTDSAEFSRAYLSRLENFAAQRFADLGVDVGIAGGTLGVQTALNDVIVHEKITNMTQVGIIIWVLSSIVFRSLVGGLMVLGPLAMALMVTLGLMGWTHTWLDMATAAFTAMGVSIGADFAIYLMFRIREEMRRMPSLEDAVRQALQTSGKAIFFVSSAVGLGYLVLPFAGFSLWTRLGVLTTTLIVTSAAATLTIVPALVLVLRPRFVTARRPGVNSNLARQDDRLREAL